MAVVELRSINLWTNAEDPFLKYTVKSSLVLPLLVTLCLSTTINNTYSSHVAPVGIFGFFGSPGSGSTHQFVTHSQMSATLYSFVTTLVPASPIGVLSTRQTENQGIYFDYINSH